MPDISVGSVTVDIVPDARNFRRDLEAKTQDLTADVRLRADDKAFRAEVDAATRDRTMTVRVDDRGSINQMQGRTHALLTTLTLLAPAAAPLTAVAIGGAAALGALGAAGYLAFKGISGQMSEGTPIGIRYSDALGLIQTDLLSLEQIAAKDVFAGVIKSAQLLNGAFPEASNAVDFLAKSLGSDLAPATDGLISLFRDLSPTVMSVSNGVHTLALDFEGWATGPGGVRFANYLQQTLPVVAHTLESLGAAGAHVVQSLLPLGGPVLKSIEGVSKAITAIPVPVVQDLFVAFAGYTAITKTALAIDKVSTSLVKLGIIEKSLGASSGGSGLVGALGGLAGRAGIGGAALGVGGLIAGGVGAGILGAQLIDQHQGGVNTNAANKIVQGGAPALVAAKAQLAAYNAELAQQRAGELAAAQAGGINRNSAQGQAQGYQQLQDKANTLNTQIKLASAQISKNTAANIAAGLTADGAADAITGETVAMAKLVTDSDKAANAAQGLAGANINVHQAAADAAAALKANGKTLDLNTQKGRDNRTALLGVATALRSKIDAEAADGAKQPKIQTDTDKAITQLETMAHKFGLSKTAAHNYALELLGIPKTITTDLKLDLKIDNAQALGRLKSGRGTPIGGATGGLYQGGRFHYDTGGLVTGPGTGTSDSIRAPWLSSGEFVVKAATVKAVGVPYLQQLNEHGAVAVASASRNGGGRPIQVTVNPSRGMSETAVGQIVGSQLEILLAR